MSEPALALPHPAMTLAEWGDLPEDDEGELVDGVLEDDEIAGFDHEVVVAWLMGTFLAWAKLAGARVVASEAKLGVSARRGRKADVIVYLRGAPRPPGRGVIRVPPSIVVEVVSPGPSDARRDRIHKVEDYAGFGVRWYWLVDPQVRTIEILELGGDARYTHALGATNGIVKVPGCEGLELDLDAMWTDLDAALAEGEHSGE